MLLRRAGSGCPVSRWGLVRAVPQVQASFAAGAPQTARGGACDPLCVPFTWSLRCRLEGRLSIGALTLGGEFCSAAAGAGSGGSVSRWGLVRAVPQVPASFAAGAPQTARGGACGPLLRFFDLESPLPPRRTAFHRSADFRRRVLQSCCGDWKSGPGVRYGVGV